MNAQRFGEQHAHSPLPTRGASHTHEQVAFRVVGAVAQLLQRARCNRVDRLHTFFKRPQRFAETLPGGGSHMVVTGTRGFMLAGNGRSNIVRGVTVRLKPAGGKHR